MSSGARNRFAGSGYSSPSVIVETNSRSDSPTPISSVQPGKMSGRDRTSEFMSAVQSLHSPQVCVIVYLSRYVNLAYVYLWVSCVWDSVYTGGRLMRAIHARQFGGH